MIAVEWEEPPPPPSATPQGRNRELVELADVLRANSGRWVRLYTRQDRRIAAVKASAVRHGKVAAFRPGGTFEAVFRKLPEGTFGVWVRYVGCES